MFESALLQIMVKLYEDFFRLVDMACNIDTKFNLRKAVTYSPPVPDKIDLKPFKDLHKMMPRVVHCAQNVNNLFVMTMVCFSNGSTLIKDWDEYGEWEYDNNRHIYLHTSSTGCQMFVHADDLPLPFDPFLMY